MNTKLSFVALLLVIHASACVRPAEPAPPVAPVVPVAPISSYATGVDLRRVIAVARGCATREGVAIAEPFRGAAIERAQDGRFRVAMYVGPPTHAAHQVLV